MKRIAVLIIGVSAFVMSCTNTPKKESEKIDTLNTVDSVGDASAPDASVDSFANDSLHAYPRGVPSPR